jgi:formate C-acetyltransferase
MIPSPFMSVLMDGCVKDGRDISLGAKYNNYGFHGVGIATAVDTLAALKKGLFEDKWLQAEEARSITAGGFENKTELLNRLRGLPHMGDNDEETNTIAVRLLGAFAAALEPLRNERGGRIRPGTGSAMYYLWSAAEIGSTLSGHIQGEAFSANYSPEVFVRSPGPLSVILAFTKPRLADVINGGPLTMEFHSTIFRDPDSIHKVALLVRAFIESGGHQLQLNSVNLDMLLDAQKYPENYKNLIVRIWGWSAYFTELDKEYQDHVISRQNYLV